MFGIKMSRVVLKNHPECFQVLNICTRCTYPHSIAHIHCSSALNKQYDHVQQIAHLKYYVMNVLMTMQKAVNNDIIDIFTGVKHVENTPLVIFY